jgi:hypothetical protein
LDEYLHPKTQKPGSKISQLLATFEKLDEAALFYQILLQELEFLGDKVFLGTKHKNAKIIAEVTKAIEFLERLATRNTGEDIPLDFNGEYCCFAMMIAGKKPKMTASGEVYVNRIRKHLMPNDIDTIYLVGEWPNKDIIDNVCTAVEDTFEKYKTHRSKVTLTRKEGDEERYEQREHYLAILRKKGVSVFRHSD